jgi:hypothetical protein
VQCGPRGLKGAGDSLYHNNGDGTFTDVSRKAGVADTDGYYGLGVICSDLDDDGLVDIFVAYDSTPNFLYHNNGDGTFKEIGFQSGTAVNENGSEQGSMGVTLGDYDHDGKLDLFITNFDDDYNTLYHNDGKGSFTDVSYAAKVAAVSLPYVGWGTWFFDYDNDGNLDVMLVNGHINQEIDSTRADVKYREPALLLRNNGSGVFDDMRQLAGATFQRSYLGRSLAIGDFDNDGDPDATFTTLNGSPVLLRNNVGQDNSWIGFSLQGTTSNRDAIGAKITVTSSGRTLTRWIAGGGSYLASHDKRVLVGLGSAAKPVNVDIRWPGGIVQHILDMQPRKYHHLVEPAAALPPGKSQN